MLILLQYQTLLMFPPRLVLLDTIAVFLRERADHLNGQDEPDALKAVDHRPQQ